MKKTAVYPGTFDPITLGHFDIMKRALKVVDKLIVAVVNDSSKNTVFPLKKRIELVKKTADSINLEKDEILVLSFEGLLLNFVKEQNANIIIRGLRAVSDFEYEFQMSGMNYKLDSSIETIFLPSLESTQFISSSLVREIARLGGDISAFVLPYVKKEIEKFYGKSF